MINEENCIDLSFRPLADNIDTNGKVLFGGGGTREKAREMIQTIPKQAKE